MKCLSVKQPWASLIASGQKSVELRTWRTNYRGPLIICASASPRRGTQYEIGPLGVAVCLVNLTDVREYQAGDRCMCNHSPRELSWVLELVRELPPVPIKGQLSLFAPSDDILRALGLD